jgi:hypothetical protein
MWRLITAISLALSLTGCAKTVYDHVDLNGAADHPSDEQYQRDAALCRNQGAMVPEEGAMGGLIAGSVIQNCMRAKGWVKHQS